MKKIETFSGSEAIKEIKQCAKKGASEGLYDPSPRRLRVPLELVTDLLFGNVGDVVVEGADNLFKATKKTEENKGVMHNPMSNIGIKNDGELPEKAGKLAPHLSLATGATIIPVLMQVEGQKRNPNQLNDNAIHLKWLLGKKVVRLVFGETIKPSPDEVEAYVNVSHEASYSKAAREEQCRILEAFGGKAILGYMRDKYDLVLAA